MTSQPPSSSKAALKFYGRRKGKPLRAGRQELFDELLPALAIPKPAEGAVLDLKGYFAHTPDHLWLEIGFGAGEHAAHLAEINPSVGLVACEVFQNGIASMLSHIDKRAISNIRIYPEDVRHLWPALPDGSFQRIYVMFPDPWPKTRHAKRRMIGPENLDTLARLMKPGGQLIVASDHPIYVTWALAHLVRHGAFQWTARRAADWQCPPEGTLETRYAAKAAREGRIPSYLVFDRR